MTFDLDAATVASQSRARDFAATVAGGTALAIDRDARVSDDLLRQAIEAMPPATELLTWLVCLEELAAASGTLAVQVAGVQLGGSGVGDAGAPWPGLRGADVDRFRTTLADSPPWDASISAVLVGLGRAALEQAVPVMRASRAAGGKPEQDHWPVADAAAALDAARLLVWRAATLATGETRAAQAALGMARLRAVSGAQLAVSASRRVLDVDAGRQGAPLERIARDAEIAATVCTTTHPPETAVAAGVLPV